LLCSDLVQLHWQGDGGREYQEIGILENLSLSGVGLFTGVPIPHDVDVHIHGQEAQLTGRVKQCAFRENGYVVGLELDDASKWAQQPGHEFVPQHLLDVSLLDLD
jgi:PilZ domain